MTLSHLITKTVLFFH